MRAIRFPIFRKSNKILGNQTKKNNIQIILVVFPMLVGSCSTLELFKQRLYLDSRLFLILSQT